MRTGNESPDHTKDTEGQKRPGCCASGKEGKEREEAMEAGK